MSWQDRCGAGSRRRRPDTNSLPGHPERKTGMVGIAVVGCGRIGRIHARNVADHPDARLLLLFDAMTEAAQRSSAELGVKVASSIDEILSSAEIAGVVIATPTETHVPLIKAAVSAGKAVLCEKPIDLDL